MAEHETRRDANRRRVREYRAEREAAEAKHEAAYVSDAEARGVDARTQLVAWWLYEQFSEVNAPADFEDAAAELLELVGRRSE